MKTKEELDALVEKWKAEPPERGKPTCPCGFRGGGRNITAHRRGCEVWYHAFGMKLPVSLVGAAVALLLSTLAANAADTYPYTISWTNSVTAGASNRVFVSQRPFLGRPVTNALHSFNVGLLTQVPATLSAGVWRIGLVSVLDGIESDLAAVAIDVPSLKTVPEMPTMLKAAPVVVPAGVTALREAPATTPRSRSTPPGHARQRSR